MRLPLPARGAMILGDATLTVNQARHDLFTGSIGGERRPDPRSGAGTLILTGASTYTGTTRVDAGTLRARPRRQPRGRPPRSSTGGELRSGERRPDRGALAGTGGAVTLGNGNLTVNQADTTTSFAGSIGGAGGLIKAGTGLLGLIGAARLHRGHHGRCRHAAARPGGSLARDHRAHRRWRHLRSENGGQTVGSLSGTGGCDHSSATAT